MKKLNVCHIAFIFAGSILGAGLVSGREIWQFFGRFGKVGAVGLVLAMLLFMLLGTVILMTANMAGTAEADKVILPFESRFWGTAVGILQIAFLIGMTTIMTSGAGELINALTGAPKWLMCLLVTLLVALTAFSGIDAAASVFSLCVPIIAVASVIFAVISVFCLGKARVEFDASKNSFFSFEWIAASLTYASYNSYASLGVLCPFGKNIHDKKLILKGTALGAVILIVISGCILIALERYNSASLYGMPMLALADAVNPILGYIYGVLLLLGLVQTAVASLAAADTYITEKIKAAKRFKPLPLILISVISFAFSLCGFSDLISTVYPAFGYVNALLTVSMLANFIRLKMKR